ncbi:interleukin-36 receptor antagonist protein-like [Terrapene carolina triunguis]|uniref:interleukin-36 receptor antagonist protein-like n=1 Tax=Terrapene triunguis TaxID=2587831 RepID=UPI000E776F64|nr:interleukin-36 receptor antagonist protein-like [Terrapene carolina triunguis]
MGDPEPQAGLEARPSNSQEKPATQMKVPKYRLWDVAQKSLYLRNNQLVAGYLQGSNSALEEKIYSVNNRFFKPEKFPIILGIQEGRRSLACGTGASPVLQLEDMNITELSRGGNETTRFTFFRSYKDGMWRFESAANPGWLLCTSAQSNEPLGLTLHQDAAHIVDFYFQLF